MIERIATDQARPGMVLGEPVLDSGGQVLIPIGEVLTERQIRRLVLRGTTAIGIQAEEQTEEPAPTDPAPANVRRNKPMTEQEIREQLDLRFHRFENHEIMGTIRRLAEKHLVQKLGDSEADAKGTD